MTTPYDCSHVVEIEDEPHHHLIIANEYVRALAVEVPPHTRTLCHHHPHDYLLYVTKGAGVMSAAREEEPKELNYNDGECELSQAGLVHVVENLGDEPFRNVVIELLPPVNELRRGEMTRAIAGEAKIEQVLSEQLGAVYAVDMQPGCVIAIGGPAVLASPYDPVTVKELEEFDIPLDEFRKLMWVCRPRKVEVRNGGEGQARLLAFQVGVAF